MMLLYASDDYHKIPYRTKIIESADNLKSYVRTHDTDTYMDGWENKKYREYPREKIN